MSDDTTRGPDNDEEAKSESAEDSGDGKVIDLADAAAVRTGRDEEDDPENQPEAGSADAPTEEDVRQASEEVFEKGKTVITDIFQNVMERLQQTAIKQADPDNPNSISNVFDEARKRAEQGRQVLDEASRNKVVNLAAERLKRRGETGAIDLKELLAEHLSTIAEEYAETDEEGNPVLNIDGEFVSRHGAEVVPQLVQRVVQSFMETVSGDAGQGIDEVEVTDDDVEAAGEAPHEKPASQKPKKVDVKFDLLGVIGALFTAASEAQKKAHAEAVLAEAESEADEGDEADDAQAEDDAEATDEDPDANNESEAAEDGADDESDTEE